MGIFALGLIATSSLHIGVSLGVAKVVAPRAIYSFMNSGGRGGVAFCV